jgi:hypothetical protein
VQPIIRRERIQLIKTFSPPHALAEPHAGYQSRPSFFFGLCYLPRITPHVLFGIFCALRLIACCPPNVIAAIPIVVELGF